MSLIYIDDLQKQIYKKLFSDSEIKKLVNNIYLGKVKDGYAPFLLINIEKIENLSSNYGFIYSVELQILGYAKDCHHQLLFTLSDLIKKALGSMVALHCSGYIITGVNLTNVMLDQARDLVLNKIINHYQILIKKEV